jgi:hypothetical protein
VQTLAETFDALNDRTSRFIKAADTFFVASFVDKPAGPRQVDVSHKAGDTAFVHVGDDGELTIPDYAGNLYFNTLGNILVNPRCGLVFTDFASGDILQMTGHATVRNDREGTESFPGAERVWTFRPHRVIFRERGLPVLSRSIFAPNEIAGWRPAMPFPRQSRSTG